MFLHPSTNAATANPTHSKLKLNNPNKIQFSPSERADLWLQVL